MVLRTDEWVRRRLVRTWPVFFQRFGRLRPIQRMVIPFVLEGRSLVVMAPAAAGKTEAVFAPLLEVGVAEAWSSPAILYVAPTRALVNDMFRRLEPLPTWLQVSVGRRTEDYREVSGSRWPTVILTTPESLDSLLCRFPQVLTSVRAFILDEVHLVHGTDRGDQLRGLVYRLRRIVERVSGGRLRGYVLSATLDAPHRIGRHYLGDDFLVVRDPAVRGFEAPTLVPWTDERQAAETIVRWLRTHGAQKALVFVNTKPAAEKMGTVLKQAWPYPQQVLIHHGRLPRRARLDVEAAFRAGETAICVATTTLELGIDIGDIDAVVLASPPPTFASFLQRLGRSNRRADLIRALAFYRDEVEKALVETFFAMAERGRMETRAYVPSWTAGLQQVLSYIVQKRGPGASRMALQALLQGMGLRVDVEAWLSRLLQRGWLTVSQGLYRPGPRLIAAFERGWLHSLIGDTAEATATVIDGEGRIVAEVFWDPAVPPGSTLTIGGRPYRVEQVRGSTVIVRAQYGAVDAAVAPFPASPPVYWSYRVGSELRPRLWPGLPAHVVPVVPSDEGWVVLHCFGYVHGRIWSRAVAHVNRWRVRHVDAVQTVFDAGTLYDAVWNPPPPSVRWAILQERSNLERLWGQSRFYRMLSSRERLRHLARSLRWKAFIRFLNTLEWQVLQG